MINGIRYTILGINNSDISNSFIMALVLTIVTSLLAVFLMQSGKKIKQWDI